MSAKAKPPRWEEAYKAWSRWMKGDPDRQDNAVSYRAASESDERLSEHRDWATAYVAGYLAGQRAARKEKR